MSDDFDHYFEEDPNATSTTADEEEATGEPTVETYYHPGATGGEVDPLTADVKPPVTVDPFQAASAGYGYDDEPDEVYAFEQSSGAGYAPAVSEPQPAAEALPIETYIDESGQVEGGDCVYEEVEETVEGEEEAGYEYYEIEEVDEQQPVAEATAPYVAPEAEHEYYEEDETVPAEPEFEPISLPPIQQSDADTGSSRISILSEPDPDDAVVPAAGFGALLEKQQTKAPAPAVSEPAVDYPQGQFSPIPELNVEQVEQRSFVPKPIADREMLLQTNGLVKVYDGRAVVNGVDINVRPGEIVGLLGPNGAGKTTTFYMIVGLVPPNGGAVNFNGNDVTRMPMYKRARLGMGYLPQEESIFRKLTVEQNIMAVMETLNISRAERRERCQALMERFGITHIAQNTALQCSGGEKRRLTIARSLVTQPNLLMLDEPFSGVDPIAVGEIQKIVTDLRESGLAILITDHNVRETLQIVDRAYLIFEGQVLREGTQDFLINDPMSRKLYLGENFNM